MHINDIPYEILSTILEEAAAINAREGVTYTYGLTQAPLPLQKAKVSRYLRGPLCPDDLLWDATSSIRQVCSTWHNWALSYALKNVYVRRWRGSEKWADLSPRRQTYGLYELIEHPAGYAFYQDPFGLLRYTAELFTKYPTLATHVRRLWFNGFYHPHTDRMILRALRGCRNLSSISVPWTLLRHGTADEWTHLLGITSQDDIPLQSLELQAVCLAEAQENEYVNSTLTQPLLNPVVDFSHLKRLKFFGNTTFLPVCDADLFAMARTATNLEEVHIINMSTITIASVMALVKASRSTLRVLEHSPRSQDGFRHPHPGVLEPGEHICDVLTSCPRLKDVSISVPSVCSALFSNDEVRWQGECQVRALSLCGTDDAMGGRSSTNATPSRRQQQSRTADFRTAQTAKLNALGSLLDSARTLIASRARQRKHLDIELFFADCIFDPRDCVVHGDLAGARVSSGDSWPAVATDSPKGPYGTTGLYGKDEGTWEIVGEEEFRTAVDRGWFRL